ncbi:hypothetical protein Asppvi_007205 [Aspergillus pseudoviridinutans]|uniref:GPI anchored protein n=1 Tax=Aspergillus pseudoviridinutans TaxID=1517512 RepID=A0A9P3EWY8_9EURO|nr:uncharacterized protein Asppvi_007205 [Aspergillus pseudoviridinutans]GIJ88285.1 hypothetical protein Asppvi_007205 [Aspergillus pseudoviridinutans]
MLLSLVAVTVTAILQLAVATNVSPPILYARHALQDESLEKRASCAGGGQCLLGTCCGDGCALNCCAYDNGGLGCGIAERCQFHGNVFVGCCGNFLGGCTGEATRVTVHSPYSTVTLGGQTGAITATATTTTEQMFTAISATPTATATTSSQQTETQTKSSSHSHRVSTSSTSVTDAGTTSSSSTHSPTTTAVFSQASPSPNGGDSGVGAGAPLLAGMVALGAVLL